MSTDRTQYLDTKDIALHTMGILVIFSTLYHSSHVYSLLIAIPIFSISFSIYKEKDWLRLPALCASTLYVPFVISTRGMDEWGSLIIYSLSFVLPFFIYWVLVLSSYTDLKIEYKGVAVAVSYIVLTLLLFYLLPMFIGIFEFFLAPGNEGPQALLLAGFGLLMILPFHVLLEAKF